MIDLIRDLKKELSTFANETNKNTKKIKRDEIKKQTINNIILLFTKNMLNENLIKGDDLIDAKDSFTTIGNDLKEIKKEIMLFHTFFNITDKGDR